MLDSGTRRVKRTFRVPGLVTAIAVSRDGRTAFFGGPDGTIHACDVATGGIPYVFSGHHDRVTSLAVAAGGRRLVSTSLDASALVLEAARAIRPRPLGAGRSIQDLTGK